MTATGNWNFPNRILAGAGRIEELAECCRSMGIKAPLVVTDPGIAALPMTGQVLALCRDADLSVGLFSGIKGNPTGGNVQDGLIVYRTGGHDGVIAFGGGSALDAGKVIALMAGQSLDLWALEDADDNWTRANPGGIAPIVAVPTTAGTGSEAGRASVIVDESAHIKRVIFHPRMLPGRVILDPELTVGLSPKLTAATGMDALSHNLEALCARGWHPMADGIALEGIRIVHEFLPRAVEDGSDLEGRQHMLTASAMGATAFQKGLGAMHALSHPLGAVYDAHHGLLNAVLMPYVLQANRRAIKDLLTRASRYLGFAKSGYEAFFDWVLDLRAEIGIPNSLSRLGIDDSRVAEIGCMAVADPSARGNPVPFEAGEYARICADAVHGNL